uniref:Uncharacterized protein n=1 Tax=Anguilla anguilla TaxID=7936 RepID=A0A0E9ULC5_ANGAN
MYVCVCVCFCVCFDHPMGLQWKHANYAQNDLCLTEELHTPGINEQKGFPVRLSSLSLVDRFSSN